MSDGDGYPTDEELEQIRTWDYRDPLGLMAFIRPLWEDHGRWAEDTIDDDTGLQGRGLYSRYLISTLGWSGNESLIEAMQENAMFWTLSWYSSQRGGHYEFRTRPL